MNQIENTKKKSPIQIERIESKSHTPVYKIHKYWARRPWNVFRKLIELFTGPDDIFLDPFAGGGVTLAEGLIARKKVVAVDLNPLATHIMKIEVEPIEIVKIQNAMNQLKSKLQTLMNEIYSIRCSHCDKKAMIEWQEHDNSGPIRVFYKCECGKWIDELKHKQSYQSLPQPKWYPKVRIPYGEKTKDLIKNGYIYFHQLFTKRNLVALSWLNHEIQQFYDTQTRKFLISAFSSTLKWASKMSHMRGNVIEGWAMHAYWIYPKYLEINVWNQFLRRINSLVSGKRYSNKYIGTFAKPAETFEDLLEGDSTYMILTRSSTDLPIPDESIKGIITDPPYGGNVNYAELADYFLVWQKQMSPKLEEIIVNPTRKMGLNDYEEGLYKVFKECYRVLKFDSYLVSTFNSTDLRVVTAFIVALRRANFVHSQTSYQPYIKPYITTFHAMQIDAFPHDFIFVFKKGKSNGEKETEISFEGLTFELQKMMSDCIDRGKSQSEYREMSYPLFLKAITKLDFESARKLAQFYENLVQRNKEYFIRTRKERTKMRRKLYGKTV